MILILDSCLYVYSLVVRFKIARGYYTIKHTCYRLGVDINEFDNHIISDVK